MFCATRGGSDRANFHPTLASRPSIHITPLRSQYSPYMTFETYLLDHSDADDFSVAFLEPDQP
jgi:hypothetical protein